MGKKKMVEAINQYGVYIDFEEATVIMDRGIVDELCERHLPDIQTFYNEYCKRHKEKFGSEFPVDTINF